MIEIFLHWLVGVIEMLGYPGIFILSALESTFLPVPSEAILIPAGYLVHQEKMDASLVFLLAVAGTIAGSLANYYIALYGGRFLLVRYGRYFLMDEAKLKLVEDYFARHGPVSIFLARLVFGVRHFISFPAGLARMDLVKFSLYTVLGGGIWSAILIGLGYMIGNNQALVTSLLPEIKIACFGFVVLVAGLYIRREKRKKKGPREG